jgi:hypothetical protein
VKANHHGQTKAMFSHCQETNLDFSEVKMHSKNSQSRFSCRLNHHGIKA